MSDGVGGAQDRSPAGHFSMLINGLCFHQETGGNRSCAHIYPSWLYVSAFTLSRITHHSSLITFHVLPHFAL